MQDTRNKLKDVNTFEVPILDSTIHSLNSIHIRWINMSRAFNICTWIIIAFGEVQVDFSRPQQSREQIGNFGRC